MVKTIQLSGPIHRKLKIILVKKDLKTFEDVIEELLDEYEKNHGVIQL